MNLHQLFLTGNECYEAGVHFLSLKGYAGTAQGQLIRNLEDM